MIGLVQGKFLAKQTGESSSFNDQGQPVTTPYMYIMVLGERQLSNGSVGPTVDYVYIDVKKWSEFEKVQFGDEIKLSVDVSRTKDGRQRLNY